ncbi:hypothetical protein I6H07_06175 [Hafnia alvei]|nr:hypothetical protein [Hafnia alvei]MBI0275421.1 hypothetical protein [Hafnia alvei]PNK98586.1 hypothetical protein CEQ28_013825 [Hafnia alvei]
MNIITNYKSKKYPVGSIHATNYFGPFEILGRTENPKCDQYVVRFISTGFITLARTASIVKGMVKDYNVPTVFGLGFIGVGKHSSKKPDGTTTREYKLWTGMFYRCYSSDPQYANYKLRGIKVCEKWKNFQIFCEDIKYLEGYSQWKSGYNMSLDKDLKFNGYYSKESCMFITRAENSRGSAIRMHSDKM